MTIPAPGAISSELHVEVRSILTFDNVLIRSVVDCITGVCYTNLLARTAKLATLSIHRLKWSSPQHDLSRRTNHQHETQSWGNQPNESMNQLSVAMAQAARTSGLSP